MLSRQPSALRSSESESFKLALSLEENVGCQWVSMEVYPFALIPSPLEGW